MNERITYLELLQRVKDLKAPKMVKYGPTRYQFDGHEYRQLNGEGWSMGSYIGLAWTTRAQTTAEIIEVIEE